MKKFCCVALILCPLFVAGCSSEQDKSVSKTVETAPPPPTKQSDTSGGGAAGSEAKIDDRTKAEL
jgi:uncharacterized protein YcfL